MYLFLFAAHILFSWSISGALILPAIFEHLEQGFFFYEFKPTYLQQVTFKQLLPPKKK